MNVPPCRALGISSSNPALPRRACNLTPFGLAVAAVYRGRVRSAKAMEPDTPLRTKGGHAGRPATTVFYLAGYFFQLLLIHVKIRIDVLYVVMIFDGFE
jgi:hypothetical protein